jgi:hypothetical protein
MNMITDVDSDQAAETVTERRLAAAHKAVEDAAEALALAEQRPPGDDGAAAAWGRAQARFGQAMAARARLEEQLAAERDAIARRPGIEKAAQKQLDAAQVRLDASRKRVRAAYDKAAVALAELVDAARDHDATVQATAGKLRQLGLTVDVEQYGMLHDTGAVRGEVVRLRGAWWLRLQPHQVALHVISRVAEARLGKLDPLSTLTRWGQHRSLSGRADGLVDGLADVPKVDVPNPFRVQTAQAQGAPGT